MAIKYTTSDGKTHDSLDAAEEHESCIAHLYEMQNHIDAMLDASGITHPANRTRAKNTIELWEIYRSNHDVPVMTPEDLGEDLDEAA